MLTPNTQQHLWYLNAKNKTSSCRNRDVPRPQFKVGHVAERERSRNLWRSKQNRCHVYHVGIAIYIHDNLLKWHIDCWVLHTKWYPSVRIDEKNPSYTWTWEQIKWRSMSKQNRRWTSTSCWHCNACMIIWLKCMALAGHCTQSGTHQWGSTKNIQVKHDLGRRVYGGQGQNKIGSAHICDVGSAMHAW